MFCFGVLPAFTASVLNMRSKSMTNFFFSCFLPQGDPELEGLLHEPTIHPLDYDLFHHTEQGLDLDLSSSSGYNNSCGSMQFQDEDDAEFVDGLFIDPDGYPCGGLSDERSSAVYGSIGRLSARPQSPLKGAYVKGSRSATYTEVLHVKVKICPPISHQPQNQFLFILGSSKIEV